MSGGIRADPDLRLPGRVRRSFGMARDIRVSASLAARSIARMPWLFLGAASSWGALRFLCQRALERAHLGLGLVAGPSLTDRVLLTASVAMLGVGPLLLGAVLMPRQHRMILDAPPLAWRDAVRRGGRLMAAMTGIAILLGLALAICLALPLALHGELGTVSTVLLLILLLPAALTATLAAIRVLPGFPAIALGLDFALREGWEIGNRHLWRTACLFGCASLPGAAISAGLFWCGADPLGWLPTIMRPVADTLAVCLTGAFTGLLYRAYRLPAALRADRRPSRNPVQRRDPVFTS